MKFNEEKYLYYAEITFYIIYINFLVLLTASPMITIGAAATAAYKSFITLKQNDNSISLKDITTCYFKTYIKKMPYGLILSTWFIFLILMLYKLPSLIHLNFVTFWIIYILSIEIFLFFQIVFIVYAQNDSIKYFQLITKTFYIIHVNFKIVILMVMLQVVLMGCIYLFPWMIIINVGLYFYLNIKIFNKIKTKNKRML